jgi:hypothetical protein
MLVHTVSQRSSTPAPVNLTMPARHRRADAIATTLWIVLLVVLNLTAIVALFIYSPRADILVQVILTCVFCAAVTFLPYHADIRAGVTVPRY